MIYVVKEHTQHSFRCLLDSLKKKKESYWIGPFMSPTVLPHTHSFNLWPDFFILFYFYLPLRKPGKDRIELHSMLGIVSLYLD